MSRKAFKLLTAFLVIFALIVGAVGCSQPPKTPSSEATNAQQEPKQQEQAIKIKFLSNLPDRTSGQGKLEQMLIDEYMKEHPNVKIEVEALQDEPYKQKFKVYAASNEMPDIFMVWGQPSFFLPVMKAGLVEEIKMDQIKDYGFKPLL
ncbi:MAG: extracellular solute-binding protein [Caldanaerobacter sp.]